MGDVAVVTYVRLIQSSDSGARAASATEETRVWQRQSGAWRLVHFHRSAN
jgi:ketosteroid isomerase-like protein